jgi:hypothetical protein
MSRPKQLTPISHIKLLADKLEVLRQSLIDGVEGLEKAEKPGVYMDGWPTLTRGLGLVCDQVEKIVGAARMPDLKLQELSLDTQVVIDAMKSQADETILTTKPVKKSKRAT